MDKKNLRESNISKLGKEASTYAQYVLPRRNSGTSTEQLPKAFAQEVRDQTWQGGVVVTGAGAPWAQLTDGPDTGTAFAHCRVMITGLGALGISSRGS